MDFINTIIVSIVQGFANSYGLDWITMFFGVLGGYLLTQKDKRGIMCNIIACSSSLRWRLSPTSTDF